VTSNASTFRSLLHQEFLKETPSSSTLIQKTGEESQSILYRLPISFYQQKIASLKPSFSSASLKINDDLPRRIGIILHELLEWTCNHHIKKFESLPFELLQQRINQLGLEEKRRQETYQTMTKQLKQFFQCPIAQWIIEPHDDERNEYELMIEENGDIATRIIDRTFYSNGIRWIVDFKTGFEATDLQKKYRHQVNEYASILSQKFSEPIHCGLYYLANNHWDYWVFANVFEEQV